MGLHKITGRAKKCGPSAMSAITGLPTHECAAMMREVTERTAINGLYPMEMADTLSCLGAWCEWERYSRFDYPTLARILRTIKPGRYVACSNYHWIALSIEDGSTRTGVWADSKNRKPIPLKGAPMRMKITDIIRVGID